MSLIWGCSALLLENLHTAPSVQPDLSDSAMRTKSFWQEDKSSFTVQPSKQIKLSN